LATGGVTSSDVNHHLYALVEQQVSKQTIHLPPIAHLAPLDRDLLW
jgi:hypothetical protein